MNSIKKLLFAIGFLIMSNYSFGQLNKSSCEAMFGEIDIKSYQKMRVVTNIVGSDKAILNSVYIDTKSSMITFKDQYLMMKDNTGLTFLLPYDKIKTIKATPESGQEYSSIMIYLVD